MTWYSRHAYGAVMDNGLVLWHHKRALVATLSYEKQVERFDRLDPQLKALAVTAVAARIGCSWCMDFGHYVAHGQGLDLAKISGAAGWRDSSRYDATDRAVLEFAEAATATPPEVTDEMVSRLNGILGVPAVVELATMVALENQRSRFNSALGLTSQGFTDRCELPQ
jgi:AhpD family alkylhydroperoxidase